MYRILTTLVVSLFVLTVIPTAVAAQGTTAITFQGQLELDGQLANGSFDFEFTLYDGPDPLTANPVGLVVVVLDVQVVDGIFTVLLDFGPGVFDGTPLWLETRVRPAGGGQLTSLFPLQRLTPVPYATYAINAVNAENADSATTAASADDSDLLDGLDSTDFLQRTGGCKLCLGHADANGDLPDSEQCIFLNETSLDFGNFLQFSGSVDGNDRMWLWLECP